MQRNKNACQKWVVNKKIQKKMMYMIKQMHIIKEIRGFKH